MYQNISSSMLGIVSIANIVLSYHIEIYFLQYNECS